MNPNKPPQNTASQSKAPETKSATDTAPNPARFSNFTLLPDETGFRIPNCDRIFEFDIYGGWFDEHKNYYNADGKPVTPPEYDSAEDGGFDDDEAERLAREYDMGDDDYEDDLNHYDNIYLNAENNRVLQNYLADQEINVEMKNVNFNIAEEEFEKFLASKKIECLGFDFEYDNRERFKGLVYLTLDKPNAQKLIEFNGQRIFGRDIKINVLKPEDEEEEAQVVGGITVPGTQEKVEEKKSSWRAQPTEKAPEATTGSTTQAQPQPQTETQKPAQTNPAPVTEGQGSQQQKGSGFDRNQPSNANPRQGNTEYRGNQGYGGQQNQRGYQKNNYDNQRQSGPIQRNTNYTQNQPQGQGSTQNYQQYPQGFTQYPVQGQMPTPFQGGYPPYGYAQQGQNQYGYPQQQYYPQQQWNAGYNQGHGRFQTAQEIQNRNNYQGQGNPGFINNKIPQQSAPDDDGFEIVKPKSESTEQATEDVNEGQWGKPLAKKGKQGK